jgi:hypothetical protein
MGWSGKGGGGERKRKRKRRRGRRKRRRKSKVTRGEEEVKEKRKKIGKTPPFFAGNVIFGDQARKLDEMGWDGMGRPWGRSGWVKKNYRSSVVYGNRHGFG